MKIGLFIPCFIDQFYPEVGKVSYKLLRKLGHDVEVPLNVQCCGQPIANAGFESKAIPLYHQFVEAYKDFDMIVMPSGSCTYHVSGHYTNIDQDERTVKVRNSTIDICDFLLKYEKANLPKVHFPHSLVLHTGCHSLRGLRFGEVSEKTESPKSKLEELLSFADGYALKHLQRPDECCGFGGTFAVGEQAISVKMGKDKLQGVSDQNAEYILSNDMSCLMHLQGIIEKDNLDLKVKHIIEIFKDFADE